MVIPVQCFAKIDVYVRNFSKRPNTAPFQGFRNSYSILVNLYCNKTRKWSTTGAMHVLRKYRNWPKLWPWDQTDANVWKLNHQNTAFLSIQTTLWLCNSVTCPHIIMIFTGLTSRITSRINCMSTCTSVYRTWHHQSTKYLTVGLFCLGPTPPKRRVVRWRNFPHRSVHNIYWVLYLKGSSLPKNDIFQQKYLNVGEQFAALMGRSARLAKACAINSVTINSTGCILGRWLAGRMQCHHSDLSVPLSDWP